MIGSEHAPCHNDEMVSFLPRHQDERAATASRPASSPTSASLKLPAADEKEVIEKVLGPLVKRLSRQTPFHRQRRLLQPFCSSAELNIPLPRAPRNTVTSATQRNPGTTPALDRFSHPPPDGIPESERTLCARKRCLSFHCPAADSTLI